MEAPEFKLYETGFDETDFLNRKPLSDQLSILLHGSSRPLVVALNGGWGSGKSFFLERWIGEYVKSSEDEGSEIVGEVIYFDAFKSDYLDDPLVSLTHAISERLKITQPPSSSDTPSLTEKLKKYAPIAGKTASKIAIAYATRGLYSSIDDAVADNSDTNASASPKAMDKAEDAALGCAEKITKRKIENFSNKFWEAEVVRTDAMDQFRMSLTQIVSEKEKLIIVIDELDRCRPDYALSLLEVIKHFFSEPNIHFVLGVNIDELANMVCARYGQNTDGIKYLQKFISLTIMLKSEILSFDQSSQSISCYVSKKSALSGLSKVSTKIIVSYLNFENNKSKTNLREIEKIISEISINPIFKEDSSSDGLYISRIIVIGLIFLKNCYYNEYTILIDSDFRNKEPIIKLFSGKLIIEHQNICEQIKDILSYLISPNSQNELHRYLRFEHHQDVEDYLKSLHNTYFQSFYLDENDRNSVH